jgi:chemotaxis protein methyltransferase CheR
VPAASTAVRGAAREFEFSERDFSRVRELIYRRAGISLSPAKQDMVYSRLARRLRALRLTRFSDYLDRVEAGDDAEYEAFTNALTTNLTSFFREPHHFDALVAHLRRPHQATPARIWCAAASTGEEPYSIAMTAVEVFQSYAPPVEILATDIDTQVLERAREGVYPVERLEKLPEERVRNFFLKGTGAKAGYARVRPELQRLIAFRRLNLLEALWPVPGGLDVIFCRNVLIYFDRPTQARVVRRFAPLLKRDGLLCVGHSESLFHVADLFRLAGKTTYVLADREC